MGYDQSSATISPITTATVSITRAATGQEYITGYAALWYDGTPETTYQELPHVEERIDRHAFDSAMRSNDIEARYNHSSDHLLGSVETGTLFLRADERGLRYDIPYDAEMPDHKKVRTLIERQLIKGSSFMATGKSKLEKQGDKYIRTITSIDRLEDVSPVNKPAYKGTAAMIRSEIDQYEKTRERIERAKHI